MTEFTIGTRVRLTEPQEMVYWPQVGYLIPAGAEGVVERLGLGNGNTAVRYPEMGNFVIVTPTFKLERVSQPPPHCDLHHLSQDPQERMALRASLEGAQVRIWSGEHRAWWRANRSGYCSDVAGAGVYPFEDAWQASQHCGPEKQIAYAAYDPPRDVSSISDDELLRRAVCSARPKRGAFRRDAVMERFMLGSTFAQQLCVRFGVDPFETGR